MMQSAHRKSSHFFKGFQSKKAPCSRRLIVTLYTLFKTQSLETISHTMFSGTYLYRPNKGVPPPPLREAGLQVTKRNKRLPVYTRNKLHRQVLPVYSFISIYLTFLTNNLAQFYNLGLRRLLCPQSDLLVLRL